MALLYEFDWDGSCAPNAYGYTGCITFSVGVFQWIPKKNSAELKRSRSLKRIRGYSSQPEKVYDEANRLCAEWQKQFGYNLHPDLKKR